MSRLTKLVLALLPRFPNQEALDAQYPNASVVAPGLDCSLRFAP